MKKALVTAILAAAFCSTAPPVLAEPDVTLTFKKGQAIDILFLSTKPEGKELLKDYFATVFPLVKDAGYTPLPGFTIRQSPTRGNYHPESAVFASWRSAEARQGAMDAIENHVADFHERRRAIWSSFAMTVYTMDEDRTVAMDADKTYVLTAYWRQDDGAFDDFTRSWRRETARAGGSVVLELEDGFSPFGYRYDPDYLAITEWPNEESFGAFHGALTFDTDAVEHVNEFVLDVKRNDDAKAEH